MNPRIALVALLALPLAACDESSMADLRKGFGIDAEEAPADEPVKPRPPAVSPLEVPIETAAEEGRLAVNADKETLNTAAFTASGNEPFWRVEIDGTTALYKTPENQAGRKITVSRLTFAQGVEYVGTLNDQVFSVSIRGTDCTDSMSGAKFPMSSVLKIGTKSNAGCAAPAAAPAPAATTPPTAAPVAQQG